MVSQQGRVGKEGGFWSQMELVLYLGLAGISSVVLDQALNLTC